MKKRTLVVVLCLACITSYAQKRKRKVTKKPAPTTQSSTMSANPNGVDTTKKATTTPAKPFDRPVDGYYKKTNILTAKVTPYPNLREADVAFQKRVWRDLDVREKMNQYLASPKQRLIDVLMNAISSGELTAYDANPDPKIDPDGDAFSRPLTPSDAHAKLADSSLVEKRDANNNVTSSKMVVGEFN